MARRRFTIFTAVASFRSGGAAVKPGARVKTVDKAMTLLSQFTAERGALGLSELARLAGLDKAAAHRLLAALARHGFVEQAGESRKYRLGPGFLTLARVREATAPLGRLAAAAAEALTETTGETAHVSVPGPSGMISVAIRLPHRANVINLDPAETLPFHATASGLAWLSSLKPAERAARLRPPLAAVTAATMTNPEAVAAAAELAAARGWSLCRDGYEIGVTGIAAPLLTPDGAFLAAIAVAAPSDRIEAQGAEALLPALLAARDGLARALGA